MPYTALRAFTILSLVHDLCVAAAYTATPRWGQAAALVENVLFVQGGRTDQYNEYSYSSAPPNNDLLVLPLASPFNLSSPPWNYTGGCSNCSSSQGPTVAWHTLSPLNTSYLLLFGGDLGPNSAITVPEGADSAELVNIKKPLSPLWDSEPDAWADEPLRRMYHSASATAGKVYIVGGTRTDGSNDAFSTHYVFNPTAPSFTELPSSDGPPGIYGHTSIVLPDGRLIVFGGYDQSTNTLVPFSSIWSLDTTQSTLMWASLSVSTTSLPEARRGFAATLVDGGKVIIQGGADADLETSFSDGWILDTTKSPMAWSIVKALSDLGPRRDHFAVGLGSQVLFGFGYATNGPASATLQLFDTSSGSWLSTYSPPPSISNPTTTTLSGPAPTYPGSSGSGTSSGSGQSGSGSGAGTGGSGSGSSSGGGSSNGSGSSSGSGSGSGSGSSSGPASGGGSGHGAASGSASSTRHHATSIALGTVFGILGLLVGTSAAVWYLRRQHAQDRFHMLGASDDDEIAVLAIQGHEKGLPPVFQNVKRKLGVLVPSLAAPPQQRQRRDMFADDDTARFDAQWYAVRRDASGSSWSTAQTRRPALRHMMHESLASLRSVGSTMLAYTSGTRGAKSREASAGSRSTTAWWDKERTHSPYADDAALIGEAAFSARAIRPRGGREPSQATMASSIVHDEDPFADYEIDGLQPPAEYLDDGEDEDIGVLSLSLSDPPPRPYAYIRANVATVDLSLASERPSVLTASVSDGSPAALPAPTTSTPSRTSHETSPASRPRPRPSSIIDANPPPPTPMRRSNSWWARFAKTPLRERRAGDAGRRGQRPLVFRDPNPPPRLIPIEESAHAHAGEAPLLEGPGSSGSSSNRRGNMYSSTQHGRSASSLQTARTADSAMIEKMGRTMDIVQRGTAHAYSREPSAETADGSPGVGGAHPAACPSRPRPGVVTAGHDDESEGGDGRGRVESPQPQSSADADASCGAFPSSSARPPRRKTAGQVAARVQAYERRMSQQQEPAARPPSAGRAQKDRASVYSVVPRPPLFVANPDHRTGPSGSASSS